MSPLKEVFAGTLWVVAARWGMRGIGLISTVVLARLLAPHDFGVVAGMVEKVNVMYRGEIVEAGPVERIFATPEHDYTRALLDAMPRLDRPMTAQ